MYRAPIKGLRHVLELKEVKKRVENGSGFVISHLCLCHILISGDLDRFCTLSTTHEPSNYLHFSVCTYWSLSYSFNRKCAGCAWVGYVGGRVGGGEGWIVKIWENHRE